MKQIHFTVDPQKCVQCNACITDCPRHIISISDGLPWVSPILEANCLECQHCLAVCPTGAVSIFGLKAENSIELSAEKNTICQPDAHAVAGTAQCALVQYGKCANRND
ncbi:4Fe-4S dicluster domain-containing protein [uncultured Desulfovibrio sp.]|uniref:4Fe-4S dicluster domain-containing protein n=1 Tax=uncultured Desulfovibrio sp. TaxID=167968 RepID=UPI00345DB60D